MWNFFLSDVVPVLAIFWMVVGGLILAFASTMAAMTRARGLPVREHGTDKLADPKRAARTLMMLGAFALFFVLAGAWLFWSDDQVAKGQFLVAACVVGGVAGLSSVWPALGR